MIKNYFEIKIKESGFEEHLSSVLEELKGKNVLIYGVNKEYEKLNKMYNFKDKFNIVAFVDEKTKTGKKFMSYRIINPYDISKECYDAILVINATPDNTLKFLKCDLLIENKIIKTVFKDEFKDECININYLYKYKFDKTLPKLIKKLNGKPVMLYGAGAFLELIKKHFDLSQLNIIGIADKRFEFHNDNEEFLGYKAYSPNEIKQLKPEYVLVATKFYISIIEDLYYDVLKGTKIKIKPLLRKNFFDLLKEI